MKLWICVPGGDDDKERVVIETDDIDSIDAAIDYHWENEVSVNDEYFMIESSRNQHCFNNPDEWYRALREYYVPETLAQFLGRRLLS